MPKGKKGVEEPVKEVCRIPWDATRVLTEITSQVRLKTGAKIPKTAVIAELLYLLKAARIDAGKVNGIDDVMSQFKAYICKAAK